MSTLAKSLAAKLVEERAGPVFYLKPGKSILEGDVNFALSIFPDKLFFFLDNAVDQSDAVKSVVQRLKEAKRTGMFFLGARLNEWRQCYSKPLAKEFELDPLSDPEINRLLDCLSKHSELNKLQDLPRSLQFAAIKERYQKELLVAMREATESKSFDSILESEFHGIGSDTARRFYIVVCCLYQHGIYIRDTLLASFLNKTLPEMYKEIGDALEGVVIHDCENEVEGKFIVRARHRIIATVVWERCSTASERENTVQTILEKLNFNYKNDRIAFDTLIRFDRLVDGIRNIEGRIKYFETACRKAPESPYVKQHYARMLSRSEKPELALGQIDAALKLPNPPRVLHHTRGVILEQMALNFESIDIARRRLVQSEESFRRGLALNSKDEYCYLGLAQLFFNWGAKRAKTQEESLNYITKAEEIIGEGVKVVYERDGLWIESAKIQKFLGDHPNHLKELEKAVHESPESIIGRYLLGRAYRKSGQPEKALAVLEPIIRTHFEEFRAFIEYSLSLIYCNKTYKEAIATLRQGSLYGMSDPRYLGTLGGMLYMDNQFSESEEIFKEFDRHSFTASELNKIQYYPPDMNDLKNRIRVQGKVVVVKAGYAFIDSPKYPRILCPGSKFRGVTMVADQKVTFDLGFCAKGVIADRLEAD